MMYGFLSTITYHSDHTGVGWGYIMKTQRTCKHSASFTRTRELFRNGQNYELRSVNCSSQLMIFMP